MKRRELIGELYQVEIWLESPSLGMTDNDFNHAINKIKKQLPEHLNKMIVYVEKINDKKT